MKLSPGARASRPPGKGLFPGARASRPLRAGLSLIEVLLSLTIFLLGLVVLARLVDMGADREMDARLQTRGARLALAKLAEFESGATELAATDGQFEGEDSDWSWTAAATAQGPPNLYLVTVTVNRTQKGAQYSLKLSQMIYDPVAMGTAGEAARPDPSGSGGSGP